MAILQQVQADAASALRSGDRERAAALRLVVSELQKATKEAGAGEADEVAVLRRERKRRHDAATAFRDGGRPEMATAEEAEAAIIEGYLPAELSDEELGRIVGDAIARTGATSPRDMGAVMKDAMAQVGGRADGGRVSARVREALNA